MQVVALLASVTFVIWWVSSRQMSMIIWFISMWIKYVTKLLTKKSTGISTRFVFYLLSTLPESWLPWALIWRWKWTLRWSGKESYYLSDFWSVFSLHALAFINLGPVIDRLRARYVGNQSGASNDLPPAAEISSASRSSASNLSSPADSDSYADHGLTSPSPKIGQKRNSDATETGGERRKMFLLHDEGKVSKARVGTCFMWRRL